MHSFKQIIENQEKFKDKILNFLAKDLKRSKLELLSIKTDNDFIMSEKKKLRKKINSTNFKDNLLKLFFRNKNRNRTYYLWWDIENEEPKILTYEKK